MAWRRTGDKPLHEEEMSLTLVSLCGIKALDCFVRVNRMEGMPRHSTTQNSYMESTKLKICPHKCIFGVCINVFESFRNISPWLNTQINHICMNISPRAAWYIHIYMYIHNTYIIIYTHISFRIDEIMSLCKTLVNVVDLIQELECGFEPMTFDYQWCLLIPEIADTIINRRNLI